MKRGLIFIGLFLVFLFVGVLLAAVFAGNLELKKKARLNVNSNEAMNWMLDTANLRKWQISLQEIKSTDEQGIYDIWMNTGKPEKAKMKLLMESDTLAKSIHYIFSNKGSELDVRYIFSKERNVEAMYSVQGKGVANKLVLAMLKKSFEEQYTSEFNRLIAQIGK